MSIYHVYPSADGESHIEEIDLAEHPELKSFMNVAQVRISEFSELRLMDFHPLTERRLPRQASAFASIFRCWPSRLTIWR